MIAFNHRPDILTICKISLRSLFRSHKNTGGPRARSEEIIYVNEMYANVTLALERCCVTRCDLQGFVWEFYGFALNT